MINRKDLTLEEIKELMKPFNSPNHDHTLLIDDKEGRGAINLALLRWAGGARQLTLTQWELPPDAVGRIYVVDIFIGEVVDIKYADWAKFVRRGRYHYTGTSHTKGDYKTFPHLMLDYLDGSKKRRHYRPMMHTVLAYVDPASREQYARATLRDMQEKNRSFIKACVQVNHLDKEVKNNFVYNLECVTASENGKHKFKTKKGVPLSMVCEREDADPETKEFADCGILDARNVYLNKLCRQLSEARIAPDAEAVTVRTVSGRFIEIPIEGLSAWGILASLFTAQAVAVLR